ncbi:serine/threonine protein kinase [Tanapox virus]|uniref:Serine/threonine protein kinase n=1 Tax=Tanapox virus TaxID=99000 RepID=A7XCT1_9POXV|nr:serine/threonine protein kinase [Tanapox virus]ABQ43773.1 serine/threonine protein kinase [Tanapox virus]
MSKNQELKEGEVLTDTTRTKWKIGKIVGKGGFGFIYFAVKDSEKNKDFTHVVKVEPKSNGPLFVEQVFYQRIGKKEIINNWMLTNNVSYLGIPKCYGFGFHKSDKNDYRFIIIDRLGCDLQRIIQANDNKLPKKTVLKIGAIVLVILKFIHDNGYVHSDIKASNIALDKNDKNKLYLIDYGLAFRFMVNNMHVEFKKDPKRMHNGTIEFTSIDAHCGAYPSRRGDLEILGYCMIKWMSGKLPWEDDLKNKDYVKMSKIKYMNDVNLLMKECFNDSKEFLELEKYMNAVKLLNYDSLPNYTELISILNHF